MIVCAAVIGQQNNPLYLQTLQQESNESSLRFHYVVHCSLDAVEERSKPLSLSLHLREDAVMNPVKSTGEPSDAYLGLLYPTEEFKIYGYASNTRVKFILVVDEVMPKDEEMRLIFRRFHAAFIDAVSNPFYTVNMPITSPGFDASVKTIMTTV